MTQKSLQQLETVCYIRLNFFIYLIILYFVMIFSYIIKGGRDAQQNELIVKRYMKSGKNNKQLDFLLIRGNYTFVQALGQKFINTISNINNAFFNVNILYSIYVFSYTLAHLSYLNNMRVPIEKKSPPSNPGFHLKFYRSIGLSRKCRNAVNYSWL